MRKIAVFLSLLIGINVSAQDDSTINMNVTENHENDRAVKVFESQKLIQANTVEVLKKGMLEFKVIHNFGDIAGKNGGIKNFFGLDAASDIKIAFQLGLSDKLNLVAARAKGGSIVQQLFELGLKYQFLQQMANNRKRSFSLTMYANNVIATAKPNVNPNQENSYEDFGDRLSQVIQLMAARKFGKTSFQLSPTYVHTGYVVPGDVKNIFAMGGAMRLPISKKFVLIADYFHAFRSKSNIDALKAQGVTLYDVFGAGLEILTPGHIFHLNFTNATNILENRFIPRTFTSWGNGQYRWGFTVARNFVLFRDKKKKDL